ncbi:MAG: RraA family protein [Candidatus Acidiferrales bacterium]
MNHAPLLPEEFKAYSSFSTCVVASAIETFGVRLPNVGFTDSSVHCIFPEFAPIVGYATTARMRSSNPPMEGGSYYDRTDWWNQLLTVLEPRVVVIEDVDEPAGLGAFVGEVHANILRALGCVAVVTNGAVRDLEAVRQSGFQMFAGNVSVSHAYAHIFEFGGKVTVGNVEVHPGDLIHGDRHGVQTIPLAIAAAVPQIAQEIVAKRAKLTEFCRSKHFSLEQLRAEVKSIEFRPGPKRK